MQLFVVKTPISVEERTAQKGEVNHAHNGKLLLAMTGCHLVRTSECILQTVPGCTIIQVYRIDLAGIEVNQ